MNVAAFLDARSGADIRIATYYSILTTNAFQRDVGTTLQPRKNQLTSGNSQEEMNDGVSAIYR